ncbi:sulfite exporter TauE/SafE family protein [Propylenella binzhouense]|uniref:Probable membrane transporter protein n=1 Tax=Propylenella binzhouense TaxID=2555902 RepID=A0A964T798_9HYPH|nr:sulfite exporter TauE/SafE family protein [Propylenella binzhouense]MYZ49719.1 sulfite exporter TauE/SafE family protein [Propylenella binzhouense]
MLSPAIIATLAVTVVATSFMSGIFGMAGGMILMGLLLVILPVPAAMMMHGSTQLVANIWRAALWYRHVDVRILGLYLAGSAAIFAVFTFVRLVPDRALVYIVMGLMPFVSMALPHRYAPRADLPAGAFLSGLISTGFQLLAGVSGPAFDVFFVRTELTRHQVVATKAACQSISHFSKLVYFGGLLATGGTVVGWPVMAAAMVLAIVGTSLSRMVLDRLTDVQFRSWTQRLVMAIGIVYLFQGVRDLFLA